MGVLTLLPFLIKDILKDVLGDSIIPMFLTFIWASFGIVLNGNNNLIFLPYYHKPVLPLYERLKILIKCLSQYHHLSYHL